MLLIVIALVCLTASFNSDSVSEWYWDYVYNSKIQAAKSLLGQDLIRGNAVLDRRVGWEPGDSISFTLMTTKNGPLKVDYQPRADEIGYVQQARRGGHFAVYYRELVPRQCVLESTWMSAKAILKRPKPARVPGDRISKYLDLWGKALALILFFFGVTSVARDSM